MNIQLPTANAQSSSPCGVRARSGFWRFYIAKLMVLCGVFVSWRVFSQTVDKLPRLAPPYSEMQPTFWEQNEKTIFIAGIIFILLVALVVWRILQPKPPVALPPEVLARDALNKLADQPEDGRILSQTSQILRRYIVAVFELSPVEMTTTEFCRVLETNEKVGLELAGSVAVFSHECDQRKFSLSSSSLPFNAVNRALELICRVEQRRAQLQQQTGTSA